MSDVDEIIDYIKSLKKGFDKDLFENKIDELAFAAESNGLDSDDFHTLFKVWLNLSIPIKKWVSLGRCLVPHEKVQERTVEYALRWILATYTKQSNFSRITYLLDWLTAAMDCESIDMVALDSGYELFFTMMTFELLTAPAMKLVYTLTKPVDVTRRRVLELLDFAKNREAKKNMYRQIQVLLGLFKSYKPECVPEDIPAVSVHTLFHKINADLLARFKRSQERRNSTSRHNEHLLWVNPINSEKGRNKKAYPLVPNMEFVNIGSQQYGDKEREKNYFDFSDAGSLLHASLRQRLARPARLRALLVSAEGATLLALAADADRAFLAHDLQHLLSCCFLEPSPHSPLVKRDLLSRLSSLQRSLSQAVPVVTRFLAQMLPFWNEMDYFAEILELAEWLSPACAAHVMYITDVLTRVYVRAAPLRQCAILRSLTNMYCNMVYSSTKQQQYFTSMSSSDIDYASILPNIATKICELAQKGLQANPEDIRLLYSSVSSAERMATSELRSDSSVGSLPRPLALALPLLYPSSAVLDKVAATLLLYRDIFKNLKSKNKIKQNEAYIEQITILQRYSADILSCLYKEEAIKARENGYIFERLNPQFVHKLSSLVPDVDGKYSLRNHLAFAPYTYANEQLQAIDYTDTDNKVWFDVVMKDEFKNLNSFLSKMDLN